LSIGDDEKVRFPKDFTEFRCRPCIFEVQRKVLTPNDFHSLEMLADRLQRFERHYEVIAKPFEWKFTRANLNKLVQRLHLPSQPIALAA
jgi:hypothetical protein